MSKWVVDIGNTKTAFAKVEGGSIVQRSDIHTHTIATADLPIDPASEIRIASVVPSATSILTSRLAALGITHTLVSAKGVPMQNEYEEIDNLGTDRILAAYAAYHLYGMTAGQPTLVVSLGTATTFECVSRAGVYLGGAITLGIGSLIHAVHERTAQLPLVPLEMPKSAVGKTTIQSLQSGILHTQLLGIQAFTHTLTEEAFPGEKPVVVATGGLAQFTHTHLPIFDRVDPDLVLRGLALLY